MITLSAKDFEKKYGTQGVNAFSQTQPQNFFQDIKKDLTDATIGVGNQGVKTFNKVMDVAQSPNFNIGQKFMGVTGSILGGASGIFGEAVIGAGKTLLPQVTEDAIKNVTGGVVGSVITPEIAKKASTWYSGLNPDEKLAVDSAGGLGAFMFDVVTLGTGKAATTAAKEGVDTALTGAKKKVTDAVKNSDITVTNAAKLREEVRALVGEKSVGDQVKTSAERLIAQEPSTPNFLKGAASRVEDTVAKYDRYLAQSERAINDIKVDPAISEVGSNMGDAFKVVVAQRRKVGEALGQELKTYGNLRVAISESVDTLLRELKESGLSYNPKTRQLTSFQGSRFADAEVSMLNDFVGRMNLLGKAPTVSQIDNFVARMRAELDFAKGQSGVIGTTNAERIINSGIAALKESLNPAKNGIQQLSEYWRVNQIYSRLSNFVEEGAKYLGKLTQAGDFAKDASIAKSAVQSILNNGKKDWMLQLEKLTGYNALDDAVLALQAMKDAGDYRGLSLLQAMKDSGIPTSKAGFVGAIIDKGVDVGKRVVAGSPAEQTRAFLKKLSKQGVRDMKVADKAIVAAKNIPKTKEIVKLEAKIAENVKAQKAAIKAKDYTLVAKLKEAYDILVTQLKKAIKYLNENGSVGMSIKKTVTPESVAKRADDADMGVLDYVIRDYDNAILDPNVNRTLSDMGLGKATRDERIRFAKEVFDEQAGVGGKVTIKTDPLVEEAKKYKSAEEFVKAQYKIRNVLIPENGKLKYRLLDIYENNALYTKYPILKSTNIRFVSRRSELLRGANGVAVGNDIVIADDLIKKTGDVRQVEKLEKELSKYLEKEASNILTESEYKEATKLTDKISKVVDAPGATVEMTDDALRVIAHELQHLKQSVGGKGVKRNIKEDVLAEFARNNPKIDMSDYYGNPAELEARMSEGKIKTKSQLTDIWNKANRTTSGGFEGKTYYHTTSKEAAESIRKEGFKAQVGDRTRGVSAGKGIFLYEDIAPTKEFSKNITWAGKTPEVVETTIQGKIFNSKSQSKSINALAEDLKLIERLKSEGYVGIRGTENEIPVTFVFDEKALKPSTPNPLYTEARKYKSAEEFVKAHKRLLQTSKGDAISSYDIQSQREWLGGDTVPSTGKIVVYRASADGVSIKAGDYITNERSYALDHIKNNLGGEGEVVQQLVSADEMLPADAPKEFWYRPQHIPDNLLESQLTDIWKKANRKVSGDGK